MVGTGTFVQTAGRNTVGALKLAQGSVSGRGTYNLSGIGELRASVEEIGERGIGIFTQTGGTNTTGGLNIGWGEGSSGTYTISGGRLDAGALEVADGWLPGEGTLKVIGDDAVINVDSYSQFGRGNLHSVFDGDGLSVISVLGSAQLSGQWYIEDPDLKAPLGTFNVLTAAGGISGHFGGGVHLPPGGDWNYGSDGVSVWVTHTPEPETLTLLILGGFALLRRIR